MNKYIFYILWNCSINVNVVAHEYMNIYIFFLSLNRKKKRISDVN